MLSSRAVIQKLFYELFRKRIIPLEKALSKILTNELLSNLLLQNKDRRQLLTQAAFYLSVKESDLATQVAKIMGLTYLHRIRPFDINLLPSGVSAEDCTESGCIPLISGGVITAVACTDPIIARKLFCQNRNPTFYLSLWVNIKNAIDESIQYDKSRSEERRQNLEQAIKDQAFEAIRLLFVEVQKYQMRVLNIIFDDHSVSYKFDLNDGRKARGVIHSKLKSAVLEILNNNKLIELEFDGKAAKIKINKSEDYFELELIKEDLVVADFDKNLKQISNLTKIDFKANPASENSSFALLIDDNQTFGKILNKFLSKHNISTEHCPNGEKAFDFLKSEKVRPDIIICDLHMPYMNGLEFLRRLRNDSALNDIPVLMLTSESDVETELQLLSEGADAFVAKSHDPRILCIKAIKLIESNKKRQAA